MNPPTCRESGSQPRSLVQSRALPGTLLLVLAALFLLFGPWRTAEQPADPLLAALEDRAAVPPAALQVDEASGRQSSAPDAGPTSATPAFGWEGTVADCAGVGLAGALVEAVDAQRRHVTTTDHEGRFRLTVLDSSWSGWVRAAYPGLVGAAVDLPPQRPFQRLRLELGPGIPVQVELRSLPEGREVAGAGVLLKCSEHPAYSLAVTGADGRATLAAAQAGEALVRVIGDGEVRETNQLLLVREHGANSVLLSCKSYPREVALSAADRHSEQILTATRIEAIAAGDLYGQAVTPDGAAPRRPAPFYELSAPGYYPRRAVVLEDVPGNRGVVALEPVATTPVRFLRGGQALREEVEIAWSFLVPTAFLPDGVRASRSERQTFAAVEVAGAAASRAGAVIELPIPRDPAGLVRRFSLRARSGGEWQDFGVQEIGELPAPPWEFDLAPAAPVLEFLVTNQNHEPLPGALVTLDAAGAAEPAELGARAGPRRAPAGGRRSELQHRLVTGQDGTVRFVLPGAGSWSWEARLSAASASGTVTLEAGATEERQVPVTLATGSPQPAALCIAGTIRGWSRAGCRGLEEWSTVFARPLDPALPVATAPVAGAGSFLLCDLAPGAYQVDLVAFKEQPRYVFQAGQSDAVLDELLPAALTVKARCGESGALLDACQVSIHHGSPCSAPLRVKRTVGGTAVFDGLTGAEVVVRAIAPGYAEALQRVVPAAAAAVDLDLVLQRGRVVRLVWRDEAGAPSSAPARIDVAADGSAPGQGAPRFRQVGSAQWEWPHAPLQEFQVQAVDEAGRALGPPLTMPYSLGDYAAEIVVEDGERVLRSTDSAR